jgi:tetratricopeptide (TPR) repeat protein
VASNDRLTAAIAHHQAGRFAQAEEIYRQILRRKPNDPNALHLLGVLTGQQGRTDAAIELIRQAIRANSRFAEAYRNLGSLLAEKGGFNEAGAAYQRALQIWPVDSPAHRELGERFAANDDFRQAIAAFSKAIEIRPEFAEAHNDLGSILGMLNRLDDAIAAHARAVALKPDFAEAHYSLGNLLSRKGRAEEAVAACFRAVRLKPDFADAHLSVGNALQHCGRLDEAIAAYRQAIRIKPDFAVAHFNLGQALLHQGEFDEAAACFERFLQLGPESAHGFGYWNLASTGRVTIDRKEYSRLSALLDEPDTPPDNRVAAGFALGKLLDDAGRFDEAFASYARANSLWDEIQIAIGQGYRPKLAHSQVDHLISAFDGRSFENRREFGEPSELPVFIVGMPRSGTTLVHQIAARHPQVHGVGERADIFELGKALYGNNPELQGSAKAAREAARAHLHRLGAMGRGAARVIDKTPANVYWLGLISVLFPGARVICCRRDARDTCLSCYFQWFSRGNAFSFNLPHCGTEYLEVNRLMDYWLGAAPLKILEMQYETLVGDLEGQSRRLIEFLGLPWDPACVEFHRAETAVLTASVWQVRQPIYQSSVGRWRHYQRHLGPLMDVLGSARQ